MTVTRQLPSMPEIGHSEGYYAHKVHDAERKGNEHAREAFKVGQYVSLAIKPSLDWSQKLRYFQHALHRHCNPPPLASESIWLFYTQLAMLVRRYAGQEALKIASVEDDRYAGMQRMGVPRMKIEDEADLFFARLMGSRGERPDYFNDEDWNQLRIIRDQWI